MHLDAHQRENSLEISHSLDMLNFSIRPFREILF